MNLNVSFFFLVEIDTHTHAQTQLLSQNKVYNGLDNWILIES
jgi:hypothetical protein